MEAARIKNFICVRPDFDVCVLFTEMAMKSVFSAEYVSLHVRKSNVAAFHLYTNTLGYL